MGPRSTRHNNNSTGGLSRPAGIRTALALVATMVVANGQTVVSLGQAANYAVLGINVNLHNVSVHGDVGVGSAGKLNVGGPSSVNGSLYLETGVTKTIDGIVNGTIYQPYAVDAAVNDAIAASDLAASLTPDIVLPSVSGARIVYATGPQTVVNITGNISLSGSNCLFFDGPPDCKFIVNVFGTVTLGGSAIIGGSSGVDTHDLLVNVVGTGSIVTTKINNLIKGTLLAPRRRLELHSVNGAVIGGAQELKLMSASSVYYSAFMPLAAPAAPPVGTLTVSRDMFLKGSSTPVGYQIIRNSAN